MNEEGSKMVRIECPCKFCTKDTGRYPGCHDHCEKPDYLKWKNQEKGRKEHEAKERLVQAVYQEVKSRNISQTKKKAGIK